MLTLEQKEIRKHALGATDCAAVMGLSPFKTPYELWLVKTGRAEEEAILSEDRLRLRHAHEITIANEYAVRNNCKLRRVNKTVVHKKYPFMVCNLDRVVQGQHKIVECKSATGFMRPTWGETGSDEAPLHYLLQVQHQLACTEYDDADIAALIDTDDYRIYPTPPNKKIIAQIESACDRFWNEHVLKDIPPAPTNRNDLKLMYPLNNGKFIEATESIISIVDEFNSVKATLKNTEKLKTDLEKEILQFIADNDGMKFGEDIIATYVADKNGTRRLSIKRK